MRARMMALVGLAAVLLAAGGAMADVFNMGGTRNPNGSWTGLASLETVPVGNPGNAPDTRFGAARFGPVGYEYRMGKFEVTAGQYTEFLNAVAATDTYALYSLYMDTALYPTWFGCDIMRAGSPGSYSYSVVADWANRPVNFVSWGDAARFANWLHNGQPGLDTPVPQDASSTEDGAYVLNGATSNAALLAVTREADGTWAIPSEDEWYKAAYHKNDGATGNYWAYPAGTDISPNNDLVEPTDPGNNATFYDSGYTIGSPYYRTEAGAHENSDSPYGTFDQGGNVWEWTEGIVFDITRGGRGGSFLGLNNLMRASDRGNGLPTYENYEVGFRVVQVPEPASLALLALGGAGMLLRRSFGRAGSKPSGRGRRGLGM